MISSLLNSEFIVFIASKCPNISIFIFYPLKVLFVGITDVTYLNNFVNLFLCAERPPHATAAPRDAPAKLGLAEHSEETLR